MRPSVKRDSPGRVPPFIRPVFFGGILLIFLGCSFLLSAFGDASHGAIAVSVFLVIIGAVCAFLAILPERAGGDPAWPAFHSGFRTLCFFLAAFLILSGFFVMLSSLRVLPLPLRRWWPLVSVFAGLALIPAGWHFFGALRPHYVVPAVLFIGLGAVLLIFSLDIVGFSFRQFLLRWWPLLFVFAGLILLLVSLGSRFLPPDPGSDEHSFPA